MAKKKKKSNSKGTVEINLNKLYGDDSTLNYLKKFEEEQNRILNATLDTSAIQEEAEKLKAILSSSSLESAFKTASDFSSYTDPILSSVNTHNFDSLKEQLNVSIKPFLNDDYVSILEASNLLADSFSQAESLQISSLDTYKTQLSDYIDQYTYNDKMEATKNLYGLASTINTDTFKAKLPPMDEAIQSASFRNDNIDKILGDVEENTKENNFTDRHFEMLRIPEIPRVEDSPMYQQNEKQINKLNDISNHLINQEQALKGQNDIMSRQIDVNKTSTRNALAIAIGSIIVGTLVSLYIYIQGNISSSKNHKEIKQILQTNNQQNILPELLQELRIQNKNLIKINGQLQENKKAINKDTQLYRESYEVNVMKPINEVR